MIFFSSLSPFYVKSTICGAHWKINTNKRRALYPLLASACHLIQLEKVVVFNLTVLWNKNSKIVFFPQEKAETTSTLNSTQKPNKLIEEIVKGSPTYLAKSVMDIPQVKKCVYMLVLEHVNEQCQKLCSKTKEKSSVLRVSGADQKNLAEFRWISILREMKERAPDILDFLTIVKLL